MSINNYRPEELASTRKAASDIKNATDDLTFSRSATNSSHGMAARAVRDRKDRLELRALSCQTEEDYFNELLEW